ncbi:MAG: nicotinamide-nucleotide adenylyltransferase [Thermoproteales archaeon]|nr:nicotinamide-nucleotide adenylyltransferase [Thermoproteales archaeon]
MYNRAFYPGRFQPFHLGHLHAIRHILKVSREIVIGVAAAQFNYTRENPFTAGERVEMIRLGVGDLWSRTYIIPIENVSNNLEWVTHVIALTPRFDVVFTNNKLVKILFKRHGFRVEPIPWFKKDRCSGRIIRKLMLKGDEWKNLVPEDVALFVERIDGVKRVREIFSLEEARLPLR